MTVFYFAQDGFFTVHKATLFIAVHKATLFIAVHKATLFIAVHKATLFIAVSMITLHRSAAPSAVSLLWKNHHRSVLKTKCPDHFRSPGIRQFKDLPSVLFQHSGQISFKHRVNPSSRLHQVCLHGPVKVSAIQCTFHISTNLR